MSIAIEIIPQVFAEYLGQSRWIGWKYEMRGDKQNKSPINPHTGQYASSTEPQTWATFEAARQAVEKLKLTGLGIIMGRGLGGVDLDGCRNPETGAITPWAQDVIDDFKSYTEVSPSKTGVKIFAAGAPKDLPVNTIPMRTPPIHGKVAKIEVFVHSRYFAVTGDVLETSPDEIANCGEYGGAWDRLVSRLAKHAPPAGRVVSGVTELPEALTRALQERESLRSLWNEGKDGGKDRSRNDASLACTLAALGFSDSDIEAALRNYPLGQIGQGFLKGGTADRQIVRLLGMAVSARNGASNGSHAPAPAPVVSAPSDVKRVRDIGDRLRELYKTGLQPGVSPGWDALKAHWTLRKTEWTVITGIPSHGKSGFTNAVMVNLAKSDNWKWAVFSAENLPHEVHIADLMEQYIGRPFSEHGYYQRISPQERDKALDFLDEHFWFMSPPSDECTLARVLAGAENLAREHRIDGVVIDPWNELVHTWAEQRLPETEYISRSLRSIRTFAATFNVHVIVVAHPKQLQKDKSGHYPIPTPYDVSGSAHWRNKADCALCVWRDESAPGSSVIYVQKIRRRFVGKIGNVDLKYDVATGRYSEFEALRRRREPGEDDE